MGKVALLFPGQGSQQVGMGQELAKEYHVCATIFEEANEALAEDFSALIFTGDEEELKKTENTQPALLTTSIAIWRVLQEHGVHGEFAAGHSLGEYSALVASGAMTFEDAVVSVRKRGQFMEEAVPKGKGTMAAILGLDREILKEVTTQASQETGPVQPANFNCPGQIVISGSVEGVERAIELAKENGAKRALPLSVSGPFHSDLMKPAAYKMKEILDNITFEVPQLTVIANVSANSVHSSDQIRNALVQQIYSPVLWEDTINKLVEEGVDTFIEVGPGKVLSGLVKKVSRRATVLPVFDLESLHKAIKVLKKEGE